MGLEERGKGGRFLSRALEPVNEEKELPIPSSKIVCEFDVVHGLLLSSLGLTESGSTPMEDTLIGFFKYSSGSSFSHLKRVD
ncbi:hypothetical protein L1049_013638 [Liquidambar formosana]|uniref:Uncharacterized protein n=1 Tax=Liquidambar formosana TaxID=63359 RepID=A0AAP0WU89_LIQFO